MTGAFAAVFWTFSLIASTFGEIADGKFKLTLESAILGGLVASAVAGVVIGWRRERTGGIVVTAAAIALSIFAFIDAGNHRLFAALVSGGLFLPGGVLFFLAARQKRSS